MSRKLNLTTMRPRKFIHNPNQINQTTQKQKSKKNKTHIPKLENPNPKVQIPRTRNQNHDEKKIVNTLTHNQLYLQYPGTI